jgi:molybdenum cofactor cytidylyltransferase
MNVPSSAGMNNTGIVILAAGSSSRLQGIKQLLEFRQKTLLQHVIAEAEKAGAEPIVVVTGANSELVSASIAQLRVETVYNENWAAGKASGIVAGVQKILALSPNIHHIITAVCDQPFVSAALFEQLYQTQLDTQQSIVASAYAETLGTPVLFSRQHFEQLQGLKGDEGAKKILKMHPSEIAAVDFPEGYLDIDTWEDYAELLRR